MGPIDLPPQPPVEPPRSGEVEIPSEGLNEAILENEDVLIDYLWVRKLVYTVKYGEEDEIRALIREIRFELAQQKEGRDDYEDENFEEPIMPYYDARDELFRERDLFDNEKERDNQYFDKAEGIIDMIDPGSELHANLRLKSLMLKGHEFYTDLTVEDRTKIISTINTMINTFYYYDGTTYVKRDPGDFPDSIISLDFSALDLDPSIIAYLSRDLRYYDLILENFGPASPKELDRLRATFRNRATEMLRSDFSAEEYELDIAGLIGHTW